LITDSSKEDYVINSKLLADIGYTRGEIHLINYNEENKEKTIL